MDLHIDVRIVSEEVNKIFGKNGRNKLKPLVKNIDVYSHIDKLREDLEIVADKLVFEELLLKENEFFNKTKYFNTNYNGVNIITEFNTIYSKRNVVTVKAIHGVKDEVYQYEVQLDSNGAICIGWATQYCEFSEIFSGVGKTSNSYGFNGFTMEKWNMSNSSLYGEKWRVGNVISCVIDFPKNTIEYFNNGRTLGRAFEGFNNDGLIYFPALTLSNNEHVAVNLGERPFKFPIQGAKPIISNPATLINYYRLLEKNISLLIDNQISILANIKQSQKHSDKVTINKTIGNVLFFQFMRILKIPYIIDYCFVSFLNNMSKKNTIKLKVFLELMWENIPDYEMICIINQFMFCMLCEFKCTWREKFDTSNQIMVLKLITAICEETKTRKQMIANVLFNKIKFSHFLHIVAPSDEMFNHMIPIVYWSIENIGLVEDMEIKLMKNFPEDYKICKSAYENSCDKIKHLINELKKLQFLFLKTLLNDNDQTDTNVSSRILFCRQFQSFTQENMIYWRNDPMLRLPGPVILSTLFRLSHLIRELWNEELTKDDQTTINPNIFYLESYNFFGIERVGGLFSYLKPKYQEVIKSKLGNPLNNQSLHQSESEYSDAEDEIIEINSTAGLITILTRIIGNAEDRNANNYSHATISDRVFSFDNLPTDKLHILSLLLNNVICLYYIAGHKQLVDYMSFKDRLTELSINYALVDYELKFSNENIENQEYLEETLMGYENKIHLTSRHIGWLMSMVFVDANKNILEWILTIISYTIKYCSEYENELFRFVPEFYIDNLMGLVFLLPDYTKPFQKFENIILDKKWLATLVAETQLQILGDNRIIHPKSKESTVQGIIMYLTNSSGIEMIQDISEKSRLRAIQSILKSDEWNMWNKTSIILMLIWHGSGFAFRYTRLPHLEDQNISDNGTGTIEEIIFTHFAVERPPMIVLQNDVRTIVTNDKEMASQFINNSLKYLNGSFSDFIILFNEIKDINKNDGVPLSPEEFNKLRMCSHRFVLTVTLLRVIEMMVNFDRSLIMDQEGSLNRVFQLICQILNRIHTSSSTFQKILKSSLPFVECIHKFTILMATMGVLLSILGDEIHEKEDFTSNGSNKISSIPDITDVFISDPNFNLSSLDFIILPESENEEKFALNSYKKHLTEEELNKIAVLYQHLDWYMKRHKSMASSINEDDLCVICYSKKNSVMLKPCEHQCCKLCADHHILYSKVCFYCKTRIEQIVDCNTLAVLSDFGKELPPL